MESAQSKSNQPVTQESLTEKNKGRKKDPKMAKKRERGREEERGKEGERKK